MEMEKLEKYFPVSFKEIDEMDSKTLWENIQTIRGQMMENQDQLAKALQVLLEDTAERQRYLNICYRLEFRLELLMSQFQTIVKFRLPVGQN